MYDIGNDVINCIIMNTNYIVSVSSLGHIIML